MLLSHVIHGSFGADRTSVVSHDKHGFVLNDPEGTTSYQGPPPTAAEGQPITASPIHFGPTTNCADRGSLMVCMGVRCLRFAVTRTAAFCSASSMHLLHVPLGAA